MNLCRVVRSRGNLRCVRSVVYTTRVQESDLSQLFEKAIVKVPIYRVPVLEKTHNNLFTGDRRSSDEHGFTRCRYQDKVRAAEAPADASPQM